MSIEMKKPVGLTTVLQDVEDICNNSEAYRRCGLEPPHYIVNLEAGNGQTTLTSYIAEVYSDLEVRTFGGLDLFLEYALDGTMEQAQKVLSDIRSCAIYTNEYEGLVSLDATKVDLTIHDKMFDFFLKEISEMANYATFLFFVADNENANTKALIEKIVDQVDDSKYLKVSPYSSEDYAEMIKGMIELAGVELEEDNKLDVLLCDIVIYKEIKTVKEAKRLYQLLIKHADFSGFMPKITHVEVENVYRILLANNEEVE